MKGGDSFGMSETDEISLRSVSDGDGSSVSPRGGQQDVGHKGVATRGGALSLCTPPETEITVLFIHSSLINLVFMLHFYRLSVLSF